MVAHIIDQSSFFKAEYNIKKRKTFRKNSWKINHEAIMPKLAIAESLTHLR